MGLIVVLWNPHWRQHLEDRLARAGWSSVTELATANPHATFVALARSLGGDVSGAEIEKILYEEAREAGRFDVAVRRTLVRRLREHLASGWGPDDGTRDLARAQAYASWYGALPDERSEAARTAWERLKSSRPPPDWLPENDHDPLIVAAFDGVRF